MTKTLELLTASECIAATAAACRVDLIAYNQSIQEFSKAAKKAQHTEIVAAESDSSACHAGIGAEALEKRAVAVTEGNCQEEIAFCASLRLPAIFINYSLHRCSAALNFFPENNQELVDYLIMAHKIAEDKKVMMPAVLNFNNKGMREAVHVPTQQSTEKIIPKIRIAHRLGKEPVYLASQKNEHQQIAALTNAENAIKKTTEQMWQKFRRKAGFYETCMTEDAEHILISIGINTINSKKAIASMRSQGKKVGLLKIKTIMPFSQEIKKVVEGKNVAVLDANHNVYNELGKTALSFITEDIPGEKDFEEIFKKLTAGESGTYWM